jgi:hypothetical protein
MQKWHPNGDTKKEGEGEVEENNGVGEENFGIKGDISLEMFSEEDIKDFNEFL